MKTKMTMIYDTTLFKCIQHNYFKYYVVCDIIIKHRLISLYFNMLRMARVIFTLTQAVTFLIIRTNISMRHKKEGSILNSV